MRRYAEQRMHWIYRMLILVIVTLGILLLPSCGTVAQRGAGEDGTGNAGRVGGGDGSDATMAAAERAHGTDAVRGTAHPHGVAHPHGAAHAHGADHAAGEPSGHSLFHLDSRWTDQTGTERSFRSLGGRVQVLTMVYTHCGYACPRILGDMKRIESALEDSERAGVGFVLASIDPERDTPERLAAFAADLRLDPDRWTLLSGDDASVLELAAVLGVRYVRESATDFGHTNLIAVLSPTGEVVHRQLGVGGDALEETLKVVRALLAGTSFPTD